MPRVVRGLTFNPANLAGNQTHWNIYIVDMVYVYKWIIQVKNTVYPIP